jgi:hypothetical protein
MKQFILYDSLSALAIGEVLVKFGNSGLSMSYFLAGSPMIYLIADDMIAEGWVKQVETEFDTMTHWILSEEGYRIYLEGRIWYKSLPLWKRFLGRVL